MKCGIIFKKSQKRWIIKALDHSTRRTIAWVTGDHDAATFKRLYDKVKHLKDGLFYTDDWEAFSSVLPKNRHIRTEISLESLGLSLLNGIILTQDRHNFSLKNNLWSMTLLTFGVL